MANQGGISDGTGVGGSLENTQQQTTPFNTIHEENLAKNKNHLGHIVIQFSPPFQRWMNSENPLKKCFELLCPLLLEKKSFTAAISRSRCPKLTEVPLSLRTRRTTRGVGHWTMESGQK
ncbi:hypothetical protein JTE90_002575 [Oedothorax gibbosus]|uniref:Uncharacterized protein n=1 Tax=Oedothorax gibbosus TaxID=931172 RepID=A0AAV6TTA4_9ARAC|nr:hypothetical protein JTE90_002575 [Oedothorax gibbosus]